MIAVLVLNHNLEQANSERCYKIHEFQFLLVSYGEEESVNKVPENHELLAEVLQGCFLLNGLCHSSGESIHLG